ncbi:golgi phosphoprotein 3 [Nematocida homosporus]|uniref:golgi phosphoprotein 3 n=1 Tax=Nematocida homosporus TaxID=1912981 RepID=UPI00221F54B7|nr:golgi phosphoprotein 3 [Nematocida homosporus]KAI5186330.1 golgi phosphoprotein 3 [Nematocida homosporus]
MDEEFTLRRREIGGHKAFESSQKLRFKLTLVEILVLLSSTAYQTVLLALQDPVSMSIRALAVCELVLRGDLWVDSQKILQAREAFVSQDEFHDEIYHKIKGSSKGREVKKWLLLLNGESYSLKKDKYHIRAARKRVGAMLIAKNIFAKPPSRKKQIAALFTSHGVMRGEDVLVKGARAEIIGILVKFLTNEVVYEEGDVLRLSALVCALAYCCLIEDVLLTLSPEAADTAQKKVAEILGKYKAGVGVVANDKEWSVFCVLREYLKLGTWL